MKPDASEVTEPPRSIVVFLLQVFFFVVGMLILMPLLTVGLQGLLWRYVLSRVNGIGFIGGLWEACALSLTLTVAVFSINGLVNLTARRINKLRGTEKPQKSLQSEVTSWDDLHKALPTPRSLMLQFAIYLFSLQALAVLQPVHLHFDGLLPLCLAALLLSASVAIVVTISMLCMYAYLIILQKKVASPA